MRSWSFVPESQTETCVPHLRKAKAISIVSHHKKGLVCGHQDVLILHFLGLTNVSVLVAFIGRVRQTQLPADWIFAHLACPDQRVDHVLK